MHTSVLLHEAIEALDIHPDGFYIDGTAGEGGHIREMLAKGAKVLGIDIDPHQIEHLTAAMSSEPRLTLAVGNYADMETIAQTHGFVPADGILIDLGLSMRQLKESGKGLSFHNDEEPLDMRLNESVETTAEDILNGWSLDELYEAFMKYSEEVYSFEIAQSIVKYRIRRRIAKVKDLVKVIDTALSYDNVKQGIDKTKSYARIFQALRIAVNDEFGNMKKALSGGMQILKPGGRLVIITFHSLEDRIVKQFSIKNNITALNKKVVHGDKSLKYERSAKMRVLVK